MLFLSALAFSRLAFGAAEESTAGLSATEAALLNLIRSAESYYSSMNDFTNRVNQGESLGAFHKLVSLRDAHISVVLRFQFAWRSIQNDASRKAAQALMKAYSSQPSTLDTSTTEAFARSLKAVVDGFVSVSHLETNHVINLCNMAVLEMRNTPVEKPLLMIPEFIDRLAEARQLVSDLAAASEMIEGLRSKKVTSRKDKTITDTLLMAMRVHLSNIGIMKHLHAYLGIAKALGSGRPEVLSQVQVVEKSIGEVGLSTENIKSVEAIIAYVSSGLKTIEGAIHRVGKLLLPQLLLVQTLELADSTADRNRADLKDAWLNLLEIIGGFSPLQALLGMDCLVAPFDSAMLSVTHFNVETGSLSEVQPGLSNIFGQLRAVLSRAIAVFPSIATDPVYTSALTDSIQLLSEVPGLYERLYHSNTVTDFTQFADSQFHVELRLQMLVRPLRAGFQGYWLTLKETNKNTWATNPSIAPYLKEVASLDSSLQTSDVRQPEDSVDWLKLRVRYIAAIKNILTLKVI